MLVALRCVVSNWPFVSVEDEYYKREVEHLRHGTQVCSSSNILDLTLTCDRIQLPNLRLAKPSVMT